eukprot:CAMPEP_0201628314 /NCGR_PEP_ID=MMETSP0493-20130528/3296_1 /ASSEMBLY_ACC=CAM_ASM_000838 /TAXON_ID=420259 /ORGANISM="Thalassiosira gravida, Strain GMp14c1" /LENGTH=347 /DNA_ID=CAMNT_0048099039 /DNA_START=74 /DNA_END=1117 /DNA_ORIENTATION=+
MRAPNPLTLLKSKKKAALEELMAERKELALQVHAEEQLAKEIAKEEARLLLLAEKHPIRQEENSVALRAVKLEEAAEIKASAVAELQAAIERVQNASHAAAMVETDPTYEISDDVTALSRKSNRSRRSMSSISMPKPFKHMKMMSRKKQQGLQSQYIGKKKSSRMKLTMVLSPNKEDARDDDDEDEEILSKKSRELMAKCKGSMSAHINNNSADERVGFAKESASQDSGTNNSLLDHTMSAQSPIYDKIQVQAVNPVVSFAKELVVQEEEPLRARRSDGNNARDQPIMKEGILRPPKPNSLESWLEWFMGDAECDIFSCDTSFTEDERSVNVKVKMPKFSIKKSKRA